MTARAIPADPQFETESERAVWRRLVEQSPDEWTVVSNLRLTDDHGDHEADLVLVVPGAGVVVVEVKGGFLSVDDEGAWWLKAGRYEPRRVDPVGQVLRTKYAIRRYVEADPRWGGRHRIRYGHAVVAPHTDLDADFATPDCPRWLIHGRGDQQQLAGRLLGVPGRADADHPTPDAEESRLVVEILKGRNLPQRSVVAAANEREERADRLTIEQATILGVTRLLNRVEVRGGAGSGKTLLAVTQAKELTRGVADRPPQRVALLCYSIGLASFFRRSLAGLPPRHRPAFCGTFQDLAGYLGVEEFGGRDQPDFWEEQLPRRMVELAASLDDDRRFDAVVVDEAQDFADLWWAPIMGCLGDEESGGLFVYSDENQRVFQRFGRPPVPLVPLVLDHNLRNTRQIVDAFAPLAPMRMKPRGGDGPAVTYIPCSLEDALDTADEAVDALLEDWRPEDVALLTTGARHDEQVSRQDLLGQDGYWDTFWDDEQVFYGHVLGFKGLERRAVVLAANEGQLRDRSRERLYVGLSRATDKLVVVGPPDLIREIGGDEVARRFGIG